jgi:hypothetical protein
VNAGAFSHKTFTKFSINPNSICSGGGKTLLDFIKVLCITIFIPGLNDLLGANVS